MNHNHPDLSRKLFNAYARERFVQATTDLTERGSLGVRELQPPFQLGFQDAVFGGQIFVPRQQLLVYRPGDIGQDARSIHNGPLAQSSAAGIIDRPKNLPDGLRQRYTGRGPSGRVES